ncbi:MAG: DUF2380 domain-containing protein [Candidatus Competibacteraceae bacterium]|nr:DUF2380 domain-containing protein [Candidatus Competibacteraceae bacterium]MCB1811338.1 DUF2380 domain-containing protein [Candidatus Competibacteraceae bacterium]
MKPCSAHAFTLFSVRDFPGRLLITVITGFLLAATPFLTIRAAAPAQPPVRVAILDFELNDLTLQPGIPAELERTASIAPMLRTTLAEQTDFQIISIAPDAQAKADTAFGYLFEHANLAAALGAEHNADWILVGRLHKPSFLFAYMMGRLVNVQSGQLLGDYLVEVKGATPKLTQRGVNSMAERVSHTIKQQTSP